MTFTISFLTNSHLFRHSQINVTSEHGPVYQADEKFEVRDRLALHAYVWEGGFRWVGNWQNEFWSASAERVGLCSHGDADTQ